LKGVGLISLKKLKFFRPAQTKKKKKLGQFSGSKPLGLSPQRALFKFREALPFGTECGKKLVEFCYVEYKIKVIKYFEI
jgi:hypothetical protein